MRCDKENKQNKQKTFPSIFHLKRLQKTQPSDKSNCKKVLVFTKCEMPRKGRNHCVCPSHFIP